MKRTVLLAVVCLFLLTGPAGADEFSLYGVTMGMSRTEVEEHWTRLDDDKYGIKDSVILNIAPLFDHRGRLYKVSFSMPVPMMDEYPGTYVTTAFQEIVQQRFSHPDLVVSLRTGRGMADLSLTSRPLERELAQHVKIQMQTHLSTLLKP